MAEEIVVRVQRRAGRPSRARPDFKVGVRLLRAGKLDDAEKVFLAALAADRRDRDAWLALARLNEQRGNLAQAARCLWHAWRLRPEEMPVLSRLGWTLVRAGDLARAATVYSDIIKRNPANLTNHIVLSVIEGERGNGPHSRHIFENGVRRNPIEMSHSLSPSPLRVLRLFGVNNASYVMRRRQEGRPSYHLRGGNFSTEHLWDARRFEGIDYHVLHGNLAESELEMPIDVVVNTIADPDVEAESLRTVARYAERHPDIPLINDPRRVLETSRDSNYRRLAGMAGVRFAKTFRLEIAGEWQAALADLVRREGLSFPMIVREPGTHTGRTTALARTLDATVAHIRSFEGAEAYVIEYVNQPYREDLFRKMRVFFIDGRIYPVVHHIDRVWNVHGGNRREVMAKTPWMMETEQAFLADPEAHIGADAFRRLAALHDLVGLDFFGADFTVTDAGEILIYEMNPAMRHSFDHAHAFPYLRPHLQRITSAFRAMIAARAEAAGPRDGDIIKR